MAENTTTQNKPQSLEERLLEAGVKKMEKRVGDSVDAKLQAGEDPKAILNQLLNTLGNQTDNSQATLQQLNELAAQRVPKEGSMTGIIPALFQMTQGKGFHPFAPQTEPMGLDAAIKIREHETQVPGRKVDLLKGILDVSKTLGDKSLRKVEIGKKREEVRATKEEEISVKLRELNTTLEDVYFPVADLLPTADGWQRWINFAKLKYKAMAPKDIEGTAAAALDNLNKRMRPTLVRAAGDVGNINIIEQLAAEQLLYKLNDTTKLRTVKKAWLRDLSRALNKRDQSAVKNVIKGWMNTSEFKEIRPDLVSEGANNLQEKLGNMSEEALEKIAGE